MYERSFTRNVGVLLLPFKILKVTKENQFIFSWRMTILFFGDLIGSVFPRGLAFRLVAESSWQQGLLNSQTGEYACAMVVPSKYIFGNWTKNKFVGSLSS